MDAKTQLKENRLFSMLEDVELDILLEIAQVKTYQAGDVVFSAGDPGDSLYTISEGNVTVFVKDESGEEAEVATLPQGSYFGEMEVIESGVSRSATIIAKEQAQLIKFDAAQLNRLLDQNDRLAKLFYRTVSKELIRRLRATTQSMGYYKLRSLSF